MKNISLSKTTYMEGLRCPKLLWLRFNRPELAEPVDAQTQHLFDTGHRVETYARQLFSGGVLIENGGKRPFADLIADTRQAINSTAPSIYEATFAHGNVHCRTDVLHRAADDHWNLGEIKMCTRVKPEHINDVGFQCACMQGLGHKVNRTHLVHINNEYVRDGEIDPGKLLVSEDITSEVFAEIPNVSYRVDALIKFIKNSEPPMVSIGGHCKSPGKCPFFQHCHEEIVPGSIHELPFGNRIIPLLMARGIPMLKDIPGDVSLSHRQAALVQSARTGYPVINVGVIKEFLRQLKFPLYFLDFETINACIPPFDNLSPYEKLPFQYSLHVQQTETSSLQHFEFLPETVYDPRPKVFEELIEHLGDHGTILAWNMSFEKSVLFQLGVRFPQFAERIKPLLQRFVDLIVPFRSGAYSDSRFQGSASIKKVLPILVPSLSYTGMSIGKGDDASLTYQRFVDGDMVAREWSAIRQDLLAYCKLDTMAMVEILNVLKGL